MSLLISLALVQNLINEQFPEFSLLPIKQIIPGGNDNRTFRLGDSMSIRLPSSQKYEHQIQKEQTWLLKLAPYVSTIIPKPIVLGKPSQDYPYNWSIYEWISGETLNSITLTQDELNQITIDLAKFIKELHRAPTLHAPLASQENFYRGGNLSVYDQETKNALQKLHNDIDSEKALLTWQKALSSTWNNNLVWVHGDLYPSNILVNNNKLKAVIDFGCMAIGDPACDLVIAWTFFNKESRDIFKQSLNLDLATWQRAKGWALWKTLITLEQCIDKSNNQAQQQKDVIYNILNDN